MVFGGVGGGEGLLNCRAHEAGIPDVYSRVAFLSYFVGDSLFPSQFLHIYGSYILFLKVFFFSFCLRTRAGDKSIREISIVSFIVNTYYWGFSIGNLASLYRYGGSCLKIWFSDPLSYFATYFLPRNNISFLPSQLQSCNC